MDSLDLIPRAKCRLSDDRNPCRRRVILLDRGLDIFQRFDGNDAFSVANRLQTHRACKPFEVTFLRITT